MCQFRCRIILTHSGWSWGWHFSRCSAWRGYGATRSGNSRFLFRKVQPAFVLVVSKQPPEPSPGDERIKHLLMIFLRCVQHEDIEDVIPFDLMPLRALELF